MKREFTALCCECGAQRQVSGGDGIGEAQSAFGAARCVVWRRCEACGHRTHHAYLREDSTRDELEDALRLDDALAAEALEEEVEQLRLCGVEIGHAPVPAIWDGQSVGMVTQRLTDHTYSIILDPDASVSARLRLIDMMWLELCIGDNSDRWYIHPADEDSPGYAVRLFGYRVRS